MRHLPIICVLLLFSCAPAKTTVDITKTDPENGVIFEGHFESTGKDQALSNLQMTDVFGADISVGKRTLEGQSTEDLKAIMPIIQYTIQTILQMYGLPQISEDQ